MTEADENETPPAMAPLATVNARISPRGGLDILSRDEIARLREQGAFAP